MPDVTVRYYHAAVTAEVTVTQTAICTDGNKGVMSSTVTISPSYASDLASISPTLELNKLGGGLTRADASFEFFADGRLKSINTTQTGRAGESIKSVISLGLAGGPLYMFGEDEEQAACDLLRSIVGAGKALTITNRATTDFSSSELVFDQMSVSRDSYRQLEPIYGTISGRSEWVQVEPLNTGSASNSQSLQLKEPALGTVYVFVKRGDQESTHTGNVLIPQRGKTYSLPIQKGPWFGENVFELALAESGQVTKLRYAGESGSGDILGAIGSAQDASADPTLAEDVNRAKLEADLIYQQQRLILCQTDPGNCPK